MTALIFTYIKDFALIPQYKILYKVSGQLSLQNKKGSNES